MYVKATLGVGMVVANYIDGKFTNIILSGGDKHTPEPIVTHWMPIPDRPQKSK